MRETPMLVHALPEAPEVSLLAGCCSSQPSPFDCDPGAGWLACRKVDPTVGGCSNPRNLGLRSPPYVKDRRKGWRLKHACPS